MRNSLNRRPFVEIYFVLYLSALVLLLPDGPSEQSKDNADILSAVLQQSFNAIPEQPVLNCIIDAENTKNIIHFDSLNHILFGGSIKDLEYEAIIEDLMTSEQLILVKDRISPSPMFSLQYIQASQTARFSWKPPLQHDKKNRSFIVKLRASATPVSYNGNVSLDKMIQESGTKVTTETSFSINIVYKQDSDDNTNLIAQNQKDTVFLVPQNPGQLTQNSTVIPSQVSLAMLTAQPQFEQIQSVSTLQWNNSVFLGGINSLADLKRTPIVRIDGSGVQQGGTAEITEVRGNQIILTGRTPLSGLMKVNVIAERRADGKQVSTNFIIESQPMQSPVLPAEMNPGITYTFDPKMPQSISIESKALLRSSNGNEIIVSPKGSPFTYTPSLSDTGKTVYFERWFGGKKSGQSVSIVIKDYPAPEIVDIVPTGQNNVIQVKTRCYGLVKGKKNEVKIEIVEGNGSVRDLRGSIQYLENNVTIQTFKITTIGTVKFRAFDQRGVRSTVRRGGE
ncbi:MAG TPA: hypothetical protein PLI74_00935 [Candidatus Kapabacteria bacterium]|nr:hypothetical protein [Ignavibacteria bacterium]HRK58179.1 hypothetical protein [Candidatus Kapabacteria bacterium]